MGFDITGIFKKKEPANKRATTKSTYSEPKKTVPLTDAERYPEVAEILDEICPRLQAGINEDSSRYHFPVAGRAYMILSELSSEENNYEN